MEIQIQRIETDQVYDLMNLISVFENVFEMEKLNLPSKTHLQNLLNKKTFFAIAAKVENKIVGGLSVYVLDQYYTEKPLAYIHDLAVINEHQRKGIGKKLIEFTKNYFRQRDFEDLFVLAEKIDAHAIDFYRKTNPTLEELAVHFNYKL